MARCFVLWLIALVACAEPSGTDVTLVVVDFGGKVIASDTDQGVGGMRISVLQLDSMAAAGLGPTVETDTSLTSGDWITRVRLDRPGSACANRTRPLIITLRFTDPRDRYQIVDVHQALCRYTLAELISAGSLFILLPPK